MYAFKSIRSFFVCIVLVYTKGLYLCFGFPCHTALHPIFQNQNKISFTCWILYGSKDPHHSLTSPHFSSLLISPSPDILVLYSGTSPPCIPAYVSYHLHSYTSIMFIFHFIIFMHIQLSFLFIHIHPINFSFHYIYPYISMTFILHSITLIDIHLPFTFTHFYSILFSIYIHSCSFIIFASMHAYSFSITFLHLHSHSFHTNQAIYMHTI